MVWIGEPRASWSDDVLANERDDDELFLDECCWLSEGLSKSDRLDR